MNISTKIIGLSVALTIGLLAGNGSAFADPHLLIKNKANTTASVSKSEVKDLFLGKRKTWDSAGMVTVAFRQGEDDGIQWLADTVFGVSPKTLLTKIRQEVFKGEMNKPLIVNSDAEVLQQVQNGKGTIGIVPVGTALPAGVVPLPIN